MFQVPCPQAEYYVEKIKGTKNAIIKGTWSHLPENNGDKRNRDNQQIEQVEERTTKTSFVEEDTIGYKLK